MARLWTVACIALSCCLAPSSAQSAHTPQLAVVISAAGQLPDTQLLNITSAFAGPGVVVAVPFGTELLAAGLPPSAEQLQLPESLALFLAPLAALRHLRSRGRTDVGWVLWGTPATLVLRGNLDELLAAYDPGLPYLILEQPPGAPACLPCHWQRSRSPTERQLLPPGSMLPGELGCARRSPPLLPGSRWIDTSCSRCIDRALLAPLTTHPPAALLPHAGCPSCSQATACSAVRSQVRCAGAAALLAGASSARLHSSGILISAKLLDLLAAHPDLSSLDSCQDQRQTPSAAAERPAASRPGAACRTAACQFVACAAEAAGVWPTDPGFGHLMGGSRLWHVFDNAGFRGAVAWAAAQAMPLPAPLQDQDAVYQDHFRFSLRLAAAHSHAARRCSAVRCAGSLSQHWRLVRDVQHRAFSLDPFMQLQRLYVLSCCRRTITLNLDSRSPADDAAQDAARLVDLLHQVQPWLDHHILQRPASPVQQQQQQPHDLPAVQPRHQPLARQQHALPDSHFVVAFPSSSNRLQVRLVPVRVGGGVGECCMIILSGCVLCLA
jgi:hypothetical protein